MKRKDLNIIRTLLTIAIVIPFFLTAISYLELQLEKSQRQPTKITLCDQENCKYEIPSKYKIELLESKINNEFKAININNIKLENKNILLQINTIKNIPEIEKKPTEKNKLNKSKTLHEIYKTNYFYFYDKNNCLSVIEDNGITYRIQKKLENKISLSYAISKNTKNIIKKDQEITSIFNSFKTKE